MTAPQQMGRLAYSPCFKVTPHPRGQREVASGAMLKTALLSAGTAAEADRWRQSGQQQASPDRSFDVGDARPLAEKMPPGILSVWREWSRSQEDGAAGVEPGMRCSRQHNRRQDAASVWRLAIHACR